MQKLFLKNEWGQLIEVEDNQLLAYIEHQNVERVAAVIELEKSRNVDLATFMSEVCYT